MRLYPASPVARTRTATRDLVVLALLILFAWMGMKVHDGILELTVVGRGIQDSGRAISATTRNTAGAVDGAFADAGNAVRRHPARGRAARRRAARRAARRDERPARHGRRAGQRGSSGSASSR